MGYKGQFGSYSDPDTKSGNSDSGLLLLSHRYYDPILGRFLTRDPLGYEGGINLYGYVDNNPVMNADPLGLAPPIPSSVTTPAGAATAAKIAQEAGEEAVRPGSFGQILKEREFGLSGSQSRCSAQVKRWLFGLMAVGNQRSDQVPKKARASTVARMFHLRNVL